MVEGSHGRQRRAGRPGRRSSSERTPRPCREKHAQGARLLSLRARVFVVFIATLRKDGCRCSAMFRRGNGTISSSKPSGSLSGDNHLPAERSVHHADASADNARLLQRRCSAPQDSNVQEFSLSEGCVSEVCSGGTHRGTCEEAWRAFFSAAAAASELR